MNDGREGLWLLFFEIKFKKKKKEALLVSKGKIHFFFLLLLVVFLRSVDSPQNGKAMKEDAINESQSQ